MKTKWFLICIVALVGCIGISCKHSSDNTPPLNPLEPQVTIKADKEEIVATSADRTVTLTAAVDNYNSEEIEIAYQWYEMSSADDNEDGEPIDGETAASCTISYDETKTGTFYYYCIATVSSTSGKSNVLTISVSKKDNITPPPTEPTKYTITTDAPNATIKGLETEYEASSTVTFTVTPNKGYEITSVKTGDESLTAEKDGSYSFTMPEKNVVITVSVSKKDNITPPPTEPTKYTITTDAPNATIKGLETEYEASSTVTFIVTPNDGYEITSVKMDDKSLAAEKDGSYSFTMPEKNVVITVSVSKKNNVTPPPAEPTKYAVTIKAPNATIKGLETEYAASSTVTFTVTPNKGYEITSVKTGGESLTAAKDGSYSFIMPEKNVEITVVATKEFGGLDVIVQ